MSIIFSEDPFAPVRQRLAELLHSSDLTHQTVGLMAQQTMKELEKLCESLADHNVTAEEPTQEVGSGERVLGVLPLSYRRLYALISELYDGAVFSRSMADNEPESEMSANGKFGSTQTLDPISAEDKATFMAEEEVLSGLHQMAMNLWRIALQEAAPTKNSFELRAGWQVVYIAPEAVFPNPERVPAGATE